MVPLKITGEEKVEEIKSQQFGNFKGRIRILILNAGKRCMLVEDMRMNQKTMHHMLSREQIFVHIAQNGLEGFNMFKVN